MRSSTLGIATAGMALALTFSACLPAVAETIVFKRALTGAKEIPPNDSTGKGVITATFDTVSKQLAWTITYSQPTGAATAAHFHGPATPKKTAPPVVPISGDLKSPIKGSATLTEEQAKALLGRLWYVNIHTAKFPDGEIRTQLVPPKK
jgi:hypothetical protein